MLTLESNITQLLSLDGISKRFGAVTVLSDVSLQLRAGEILGLVGENGAGKSTLIKVLTGLYQADAGSISLNGNVVSIDRPADAEALGIAVIHQERHFAPQLRVFEQLFLGLPQLSGALPNLRKIAREAATRITEVTGQSIDPNALMSELTVAQQQLIQITRAVLSSPKVLILDEPTAPLASGEVRQLFEVVRRLQAQGVGIIFVSHYLQELEEITDRVTVLRNGFKVADVSFQNGATVAQIVELMVGRQVTEFDHARVPRKAQQNSEVLRLEGLSGPGALTDVSLTVHAGEVVGVTGLVGSGIETLADAVVGAIPHHGTVEIHGNPVRRPAEFVSFGGGIVPSNRRVNGAFQRSTVRENLVVSTLDRLGRRLGLTSLPKERKVAQELITQLDVRPAKAEYVVGNLSGGNQQKVVLGKWLASRASVLVLDQPTSGVDVGSRTQIYEQLNSLVDSGTGALVVTVDLEELVGIADRIFVLYRGRIIAELSGHDVTTDQILQLASSGDLNSYEREKESA